MPAQSVGTKPGSGTSSTSPSYVTGATGVYDSAANVYVGKGAHLRNLANSLTLAKVGTRHARWFVDGDSIVDGTTATTPINVNSWPDRMRTLLNGRLDGLPTYEGPVWFPAQGFGDSRCTIPAGWNINNASSKAGPGGFVLLESHTPASILSFGPVYCDSFTVYYATGASNGTFTTDVDGGQATTTASAGATGWATKTITVAAGLGWHTLNVTPPAGGTTSVMIFAIEWDDSSRGKGVKVSRMGAQGTQAGNWSDSSAGGAISSLQTTFDMPTPDVVFLGLGTNDQSSIGVTPAVYATNMQTIITKAQAVNCDVVLVAPFANNQTSGGHTVGEYVAQLYALADLNGLVVVDLNDHFPSTYAAGNTAPFSYYNDTVHPNDKGIWEIARTVANAVLRLVAPADGPSVTRAPGWGFRSGFYYSAPTTAGSASALAVGNITAMPLRVPSKVTTQSLHLEVTTGGGAGCLGRLGIYAAGPDGLPGALVVDAGTVDITTVSAKTLALSQTLTPGLYYLVVAVQGTFTGNPQFRFCASPLEPAASTAWPAAAGNSGFLAVGATGALPAIFPSASFQAAGTVRMAIRVA